MRADKRARAGVSTEQAALLAALMSGPDGLCDPPRPCSIAELQALHARCAGVPVAWEQLCALWDTALVRPAPTLTSACAPALTNGQTSKSAPLSCSHQTRVPAYPSTAPYKVQRSRGLLYVPGMIQLESLLRLAVTCCMCAVQRAVGKFRGVPAPSFPAIMDAVAVLLRKPIRAR